MAGNRSKIKGNTWERETANYLSNLFDRSFVRVPNSGSFIGGTNSYRKQSLSEQQIRSKKGDIIPPDDFPKAMIECKFYGELPFHSIVAGIKVPKLTEWINQAKYDCDEGDVWIVIFKINRRGKFIVIDKKQFREVSIKNYCLYENCYICNFDTFFETNKELIEQKWKNGVFNNYS